MNKFVKKQKWAWIPLGSHPQDKQKPQFPNSPGNWRNWEIGEVRNFVKKKMSVDSPWRPPTKNTNQTNKKTKIHEELKNLEVRE